jgi:hypothetical protein
MVKFSDEGWSAASPIDQEIFHHRFRELAPPDELGEKEVSEICIVVIFSSWQGCSFSGGIIRSRPQLRVRRRAGVHSFSL